MNDDSNSNNKIDDIINIGLIIIIKLFVRKTVVITIDGHDGKFAILFFISSRLSRYVSVIY